MAPSGTVRKQKVKIYTVDIEILLYQFKFKYDATIKYFVKNLLFFLKLSVCFYSVEDYMIHLLSVWIDQEQ
jgi:hypothetical protein